MSETFPNLVISAELVYTVSEGCAISDRPLTLSEVAHYASCTDRAAREALKGATWLGLVETREGKFAAASGTRHDFPASKEKAPLLFRQFLQKKKSFVQFASFLDSGNSPLAAAEKVVVLYQVKLEPGAVLKLFSGWGRYAGVFTEEEGRLSLKPELRVHELPVEYLKGLRDALESDMKARIFISRKLTEETFRLVHDAGVERAVRALRGVGTDPRNSIEDIGEVFEDYLRTKAVADGVSVTSANGIGGVVQALVGQGRITGEHRTLADAVNTLRIIAAHPERAKTGLRWEIGQDSGLDAVLLTLSLIRSMHALDLTGKARF